MPTATLNRRIDRTPLEYCPRPAASKIRLDGVGVTFSTQKAHVQALDDVSLSIEPGEFVCLIGPSGCGKSTLLNVIAGLQRPTKGRVLMDDQPITGPGPDRAVIFQEASLFPWLTAVQNVEFAVKHVKSRRDRRALAMEHLRLVHLSRFAHAHLHELSGGMRQRVAIARALAMNPDVLLMDEPFASLDAQTRDVLIEELQRIWMETRKTIVFVTHNVLEAVSLGDRVISMATRPGRIRQGLRIQMGRPRSVENPDTAWYAQQLLLDLKDEIARIVREESDFEDSWAGSPDSILYPGSGLMGDGI